MTTAGLAAVGPWSDGTLSFLTMMSETATFAVTDISTAGLLSVTVTPSGCASAGYGANPRYEVSLFQPVQQALAFTSACVWATGAVATSPCVVDGGGGVVTDGDYVFRLRVVTDSNQGYWTVQAAVYRCVFPAVVDGADG